MDEIYHKEIETTEYLVDRNREYSEVLAENERIHVYGNGLVESDGEAIITGWNGSVIAESDGIEIITYEYEDYGKGSKKETGHGFQQEIKDASGLIYLRARYYDPEIGRFIQIDQHYDGEANNTASQNRYMYGLNNPYKYVDRDGKIPFNMLGGGGKKNPIGNIVNGIKNTVNKASNTLQQATSKAVQEVNKVINKNASSNAKNGYVSNNKPSYTNARNDKVNEQKNTPQVQCREEDIQSIEEKLTPLEILQNCINWGMAIKECIDIFTSNLKVSRLNTIAKYIQGATIKGMKITISGSRKLVKDLTGLSTGPITYASTARNTVFKKLVNDNIDMLRLKTNHLGFFMLLYDIGKDFATKFFEFSCDMIEGIRVVTYTLSSVVYNALRIVSGIVLKSVLLPFCNTNP